MEQVELRRYDTSQPWGFRMQGGLEYNRPLYLAQVSPKSIAGKAGLHNGDAILQICGQSTAGMTHSQAKQALLRAGNDVDLVVQRGVVNTETQDEERKGEKRVELDEQSIDPGMNEGSKYRNVMPKSYKILEAQLQSGEGQPPAPSVLGQKKSQPRPQQAAAAETGAKSSSIFDRKKQDRSDYLVAQGQSIQKVYGEKN